MYKEKEEEKKLPTTRRIPGDDIDLYEVMRAIGRGFKAVGSGIAYLFNLIIRRIVLIATFVTIGIALGLAAYFLTRPYYVSSMTFVLANIRNEFIEDQLSRLSEMVEEGNYNTIANELDIQPEAARQIKEMQVFNLDQDRIEEDSVLTGSPFRVELSLYDRSLFDEMEPALTNYLESNRYFTRQKAIKQRQVESMISKLKEEIASLDSIKTQVGSPRGPVNGFVYGQPVDPTNLYRESITLYKQQVELEASLEKLDNVEVVTEFAPRLRPTGPNWRKYVLIGASVAFIFGFVVALVKDSRRE